MVTSGNVTKYVVLHQYEQYMYGILAYNGSSSKILFLKLLQKFTNIIQLSLLLKKCNIC